MQRRDFVKQVGFGLIAASIGGCSSFVTPRQARQQGAEFKVLTLQQAQALDALGETLLPGAAKAGIAHFVDYHLSVPSADSLLMLRYLDIPPPYAPFYQSGLSNLDGASITEYQKPFADLDSELSTGLIVKMASNELPDWQGFPAGLFYFAVRADAVDVVYGTEEGFEELGIPYMAHIRPTSRW